MSREEMGGRGDGKTRSQESTLRFSIFHFSFSIFHSSFQALRQTLVPSGAERLNTETSNENEKRKMVRLFPPAPADSCVSPSPCLRVPVSPRPFLSQRPLTAFILFVALLALSVNGFAQGQRSSQKGSHTRAVTESMSPEARELVERAIDVICTERKRDPKGSVPIDDMQGRPSLPLHSAEAVAGAARAQRLLPIAKGLAVDSLQKLAAEYKFDRTRAYQVRIQRAIARIQMVRRVQPDMDSRDNASVLLRRPHIITFGTIFLAGLPSDEAMVSVLAHELAHIADGDRDSLKGLFDAVGRRGSALTGLKIYSQRAEELTCDLIGTVSSRMFVTNNPGYDSLSRRIARSVEHNCVDADEGDEDHLSPRNTIRALLALSPDLTQELVYGHLPARSPR